MRKTGNACILLHDPPKDSSPLLNLSLLELGGGLSLGDSETIGPWSPGGKLLTFISETL